MKQFLTDPDLSATAKAIFAMLCGLALTPEEVGDGALSEYLKTDGESEIDLQSLAEDLSNYMKEDIAEIKRAAKELEEYWKKQPFAE